MQQAVGLKSSCQTYICAESVTRPPCFPTLVHDVHHRREVDPVKEVGLDCVRDSRFYSEKIGLDKRRSLIDLTAIMAN